MSTHMHPRNLISIDQERGKGLTTPLATFAAHKTTNQKTDGLHYWKKALVLGDEKLYM